MFIVILVTAGNFAEARKISQALVEKKLAACVNIVENIHSVFRWEGKVDQAREVLMIIKSRKLLFPKIVKAVQSMHSYSVPEIIALPILLGQKDYLSWMKSSVGEKIV